MIKFDFSVNNTMTEFENRETEPTVYLGFANKPEINIFSWKYASSPYSSTTEILLKEGDKLLKVPEGKDYTVMIHLVQGWVNLDAATAALAIQQDRKELKSRDWSNLAIYISDIEKGSTTPPFLRSLYAFYHATREMVLHKKEFKELLNCKMQWIDDKTAKVVLSGEENDVTNGSFVSISGATEETCNGQFEVVKASPKELMIQPHSDFAWETSFKDQQIKLLSEKKLIRRNQEVITSYHKTLKAFLKLSGVKKIINKPDDFRIFMELLPSSFPKTAHEEILNSAEEEYMKQDYLMAEKFEVDLPLKNATGNQTHYRVPLLGLVEPQSGPLLKFFARNPMIYPGSLDQSMTPQGIQPHSEEKRYPMTYVNKPTNNGKASEHVISIPHAEPYNLKGLSKLLEKIEDRSTKEKKEVERPKDKPRKGGYEYNDPWYDERNSNNSIIDNPKKGSRLNRLDVLEALWHFGNPLERIKVEYATTSIFIPFWVKKGIDVKNSICEKEEHWKKFNYQKDLRKENIEIGHAFLPFAEEIFNSTDQDPDERGSLQAWNYNKKVELTLKPRHLQSYGPAVNVIREIAEKKVKNLLDKAKKIDLRVFSYEFGFGIINLDIHLSKGCSIMDTQWLKHLISITDCKELLKITKPQQLGPFKKKLYDKDYATADFTVTGGGLIPGNNLKNLRINKIDILTGSIAHTGSNDTTAKNIKDAINNLTSEPNYNATVSSAVVKITAETRGTGSNGLAVSSEVEGNFTVSSDRTITGGSDKDRENKILMPHKHYVCTTLSQFDYEGGSMTDCRSLGGGLQMAVSDAEPLFHNLPKEKRLKTDQTVVDEVTKRHFYCSPSSMLNFDDVAFEWEHAEYHAFVSMLYNMVLAQRFILSQSRKEIIEREWEYNKYKKEKNFGEWLKLKLKIFFKKTPGPQLPEEKISEIREDIQHMTTSSWFNVVSSDRAFQEVFEKLRNQMKVNEFYTEVQERCKDLDEFITKKQGSVQSRVFDIFTFVMSPLSLVVGFMGGTHLSRYFNRLNEDTHPFPFFDIDIQSGWIIFLIYGVLFSVLFLLVWILYKYKSFKA